MAGVASISSSAINSKAVSMSRTVVVFIGFPSGRFRRWVRLGINCEDPEETL
jgi:hypothetical protein